MAGRTFAVQAWIYPTLAGERVQTVLSQGCPGRAGWAFELDEQGRLRLREWSPAGERVHLQSAVCLASHSWYFVAAVIDRERAAGRLRVAGASPWMGGFDSPSEEADLAEWPAREAEAGVAAGIHIAACEAEDGAWGTEVFNGKIDSPRLFETALTDSQLDLLAQGADPAEVARGKLAGAWDMSVALDSACVIDRSPAAAHGTCVNMPTRAVTGHRWKGQTLSPAEDPSLYGAIHFHDDDLADAGWSHDLELPIDSNLVCGLYAVKLSSGEDRAYVPFYVRPAAGAPTAPVLFLAPTNTYLAYANDRLAVTDVEAVAAREGAPLRPIDQFVAEHPALGGSLYDTHRDGSGICYASRLRPMPNIDPTHLDASLNRPRHFAADLHLLNWLATQGQHVDTATDEDLHREGAELLRPYRVILTGSHPEYWTGAMLDALTAHLEGGGSLMYLGGNGFYWVTSFHSEAPHVIEVRRGGFAATWHGMPGEEHHSSTGEQGGKWRQRGRGASGLAGVTTMGYGMGPGVGYRRLPQSHDERTSFIFEGVEGERFGDFGPAFQGAAGDEVDATDPTLSTPTHAAVLARSETLVGYLPMLENELVYLPNRVGENNPQIRSELVYFETGHGGAVFSVGSINWCGALAYNDYDNDVCTITGNVLRKFLADQGDE
jgi:N,N-dimethylformamidase